MASRESSCLLMEHFLAQLFSLIGVILSSFISTTASQTTEPEFISTVSSILSISEKQSTDSCRYSPKLHQSNGWCSFYHAMPHSTRRSKLIWDYLFEVPLIYSSLSPMSGEPFNTVRLGTTVIFLCKLGMVFLVVLSSMDLHQPTTTMTWE